MKTYAEIIKQNEIQTLDNKSKIDSLDLNMSFERETGQIYGGSSLTKKMAETMDETVGAMKDRIHRLDEEARKQND